jgi:hypothetical protein
MRKPNPPAAEITRSCGACVEAVLWLLTIAPAIKTLIKVRR